MIRKTLCALIVSLVSAAPVLAAPGTTRGVLIACASRDHYFQMWDALRDDDLALNYLMEKRLCFIPKPGLNVSILGVDHEYPRVLRVRIYFGESAIEVWVGDDEIE